MDKLSALGTRATHVTTTPAAVELLLSAFEQLKGGEGLPAVSAQAQAFLGALQAIHPNQDIGQLIERALQSQGVPQTGARSAQAQQVVDAVQHMVRPGNPRVLGDAVRITAQGGTIQFMRYPSVLVMEPAPRGELANAPWKVRVQGDQPTQVWELSPADMASVAPAVRGLLAGLGVNPRTVEGEHVQRAQAHLARVHNGD